MRRTPVFLLLAAATFSSALADPPAEDVLRPVVPSTARIYIEPHAGINFTLLDGNPTFRELMPHEGVTTIFNSATGIAPLIGVTFGYRVNDVLGAELDLSYDSRRASNSGITQDTCTIFDEQTGEPTGVNVLPATKEYTIGADYFSVGLALTATFEPLMLTIGPVFSMAMSRVVEESSRVDIDPSSQCAYFYGESDVATAVVGSLDESIEADARLSLRIGAAAAIDLATGIQLVPRVAFDLGLADTFTGTGEYRISPDPAAQLQPEMPTTSYVAPVFNNAIRMSSLQASLGIRINL